MINLRERSQSEETSNLWPKSWTNPFAKNANFQPFKYQRFCSLESFLYQECRQTLFLIDYNQNKQGEETSNFWPRSWTNPFAKNGNFLTFKYQRFCSLEKVFLYQEWHQIHFLINLKEKYQGEETSNFWPKSWTNFFARDVNF